MPSITIINNWNEEERIEARLLGRGTFATCYESNGTVYSYVKNHPRGYDYTDYSKQAVAEFASDSNPHIPKINHLGAVQQDAIELYSMPLYFNLTKESAHAWNQAKILMNAHKRIKIQKNESAYDCNLRIIEFIRGKVDDSIIEAIESIAGACANYGDYYKLEFNKRNLKVDSNGNLILLDVIFNRTAVLLQLDEYFAKMNAKYLRNW